MAEKITLNVEPRTLLGRKIKKLRREGLIPGNVFGAKTKSTAVQVKVDVFMKIFDKAGETNLVYITIGDEKTTRPALITSVQYHPVTDAPLHVDFHQVDLTQTVTANIPVELIGESPAVENGAIISQMVNEVEVEALPTDLPEKFEVDISTLKEMGDFISVKDLKTSDKVEIKSDPELQLVAAQEPQKEEEVEAPAEAAEGETPAAPAEGEVGSASGGKPEEKPAE